MLDDARGCLKGRGEIRQAFATGIGLKTAYGLRREFHCLLQLPGRLAACPRSRSTVSDYRACDIKIVENVATAGEARFKVGRSGLS